MILVDYFFTAMEASFVMSLVKMKVGKALASTLLRQRSEEGAQAVLYETTIQVLICSSKQPEKGKAPM